MAEYRQMKPLFVVDGKPFFPLGGQSRNCSGYNAAEMKNFWKAMELLGGNTAEVPVAWEVIEAEEGKFDFSAVDHLIESAEEKKVKLILLWFATWKNGVMKFAPGWVKKDRKRFKRVISPVGKELSVLSSHCEENYAADCKAFCALMEHIHSADKNHTVIAMQVENESGIFGQTHRDHGAEAEKEFHAPVPQFLIEKMKETPQSNPYAIWKNCGSKDAGTWSDLFGDHAAELFTAWSIAKYINGIAREGKKKHNIPMFVNVWLDQQGWEMPGMDYPSGSPIERTFDIWKWTAPDIDTIAPDNYKLNTGKYRRHCQFYSRDDNPLLIPESPSWDASNAYHMLYAIGEYNAAGYFAFGLENMLTADGKIAPESKDIVDTYRFLMATLPLILKYKGTPQMHTIVQEEKMMEQQLTDLGDFMGLVKFCHNGYTDCYHLDQDVSAERGRGFVIQTDKNEFYAMGVGFFLYLRKKCGEEDFSEMKRESTVSYLKIEEGYFDEDGNWKVVRIRNGDETDDGIWVLPDVGAVRVVLDI